MEEYISSQILNYLNSPQKMIRFEKFCLDFQGYFLSQILNYLNCPQKMIHFEKFCLDFQLSLQVSIEYLESY